MTLTVRYFCSKYCNSVVKGKNDSAVRWDFPEELEIFTTHNSIDQTDKTDPSYPPSHWRTLCLLKHPSLSISLLAYSNPPHPHPNPLFLPIALPWGKYQKKRICRHYTSVVRRNRLNYFGQKCARYILNKITRASAFVLCASFPVFTRPCFYTNIFFHQILLSFEQKEKTYNVEMKTSKFFQE